MNIAGKQGREGNAAGGNAHKLHIEAIFLIEPEFLGNPKGSSIAGERAVRNDQRLEFLFLGVADARQ